MPDRPLEAEIESKVCHYARQKYKIIPYKFVSPNYRSVPDRLFIGPNGLHFFVEFKREGNVPTKAQEREIRRLRDLGHHVYVCDSTERGYTIIDLEIESTTPPLPTEGYSPHIGAPAVGPVAGHGIGQDHSRVDQLTGEDGSD